MKKTINSLLFLVYLVAGTSISGGQRLFASALTKFSASETGRFAAGARVSAGARQIEELTA